MNAKKYQQYIIPRVQTFLKAQRPGFVFQQDGAPAHTAFSIRMLLRVLGIEALNWPAKSPDLSLIENVWHWMKAWIEMKYPNLEWLSLPALRRAIQEAWEALDPEWLRQLAHSMPRRLQMVIEKKGGRIPY